MSTYKHSVHYYETDRMGITHHSNYVRWMEEARIDFLKQIGWDYAKLEEMGIISPVIEASCKYKETTTFGDEISIEVSVKEFKGVKLFLHYEMKNEKGKVVCIGESGHCFLNKEGMPIIMKKLFPEFYQTLVSLVKTNE